MQDLPVIAQLSTTFRVLLIQLPCNTQCLAHPAVASNQLLVPGSLAGELEASAYNERPGTQTREAWPFLTVGVLPSPLPLQTRQMEQRAQTELSN